MEADADSPAMLIILGNISTTTSTSIRVVRFWEMSGTCCFLSNFYAIFLVMRYDFDTLVHGTEIAFKFS